MDCLITLIANACLLDISHVVLRADTHWQVSHRNFYFNRGVNDPYSGGISRIEVMAGGNLTTSIRLYYGLGHQSYLGSTSDAGYEYVAAGLEWRPFAR